MSKLYRSLNYNHNGSYIRFDVMVNDEHDTDDMLGCELETNPLGIFFTVKASLSNREAEEFGHFRFSSIHGIGCAVLVSSDTFVEKRWRGTPWSQKFRVLKEDIAKSVGCSLLIATANAADVPAYKNLLKSGYKISEVIINKATGHPVAVGTKKVQ